MSSSLVYTDIKPKKVLKKIKKGCLGMILRKTPRYEHAVVTVSPQEHTFFSVRSEIQEKKKRKEKGRRREKQKKEVKEKERGTLFDLITSPPPAPRLMP